MHIAIAGCSGVIGPHLIQWVLANSEATVVGCDAGYERLGDLLRSDRFAYYFADESNSDQLLRQLVGDADVLVDLRALEYAGDAGPPGSPRGGARAQMLLAAACADAKTRLVHVLSANMSSGADAPAAERVESPVAVGHATVRGGSRAGSDGAEPELLRGDASQVIRDYGTFSDLQFVVVRLSDVLGDQLEVVPRSSSLSSLERLRDAFLMGTDDLIELGGADLQKRNFVYVMDAASALGRIAVGRVAALPAVALEVGNPGIYMTRSDVARTVLEAYKARYWDRHSPTPRLAEVATDDCAPGASAPLIDISLAQSLLDWHPRWPLTGAIDDALPRLLGGH